MRNIFFMLLFLTIYGCTYSSQSKGPTAPVTYKAKLYRSAGSVGNLRRLALMPAEMLPYKGKYVSLKDQVDAALNYEDACAHFLNNKKGYEIVVVRNEDGRWRSVLFEGAGFNHIQELYQKWNKEKVEKHTTSIIQKIGGALNVDGVLVIRIKERKPWGTIDTLLNLTLMNIPLFYNLASPDIGAWIYETSTGRLVWSEEHSIFGNETAPTPIPITESLIDLFVDMENAVPYQLTK